MTGYKNDERFEKAADAMCGAWVMEDAGDTAGEEKKLVRRLADELARDYGATINRVEGDIFDAASARYAEGF